MFSWHAMQEVLPKEIATLSQQVVEMTRIFSKCSGWRAHARGICVAGDPGAMLMALHVNVDFSEELLKQSVISVPAMQWW